LQTGAILLAAGASTRLGAAKQLLQFRGSSLVKRAARSLLDAGCSPVVVVIGACPEVADEIRGLAVHPVRNNEWRSGMASSLHAGLKEALIVQPALDAILISVCDQPLVVEDDLRSLVQLFYSSRFPIAAAQYGSTLGVPAIFRSTLFGDLMSLVGDAGARRIIQERRSRCAVFPLENAGLDVDRTEDLERLK
jgi:molybdenum cofactor cytidylyltransferase